MKAKISRGKGFSGALNYVCDDEKNAQVVGGNMSSDSAAELSSEFKVSRALRPDCKKPVWHCSLSLPQRERLSDEKWQEVTDNYMQRMGLDPANHQFVAVRHGDTDHDHVHIVASRIGLDSKLWHGQHDVRKAINACQELEQTHGLTLTPGLSMDENHKSSLKRGEIEMSLKTGEAPPKLVLQNAIDEALKDKPDTAQFIERLESAGITPRPNVASTGRMNGFSFDFQGVAFKASQLGKSYSFGQLQKRGLDYDRERDTELLRAAKERSEQAELEVGYPPHVVTLAHDQLTPEQQQQIQKEYGYEQNAASQITSDAAQQSDQRADQGDENAANAERGELSPADRATSPESGDPQRRGPRVNYAVGSDRRAAAAQERGAMAAGSGEVGRSDKQLEKRAPGSTPGNRADQHSEQQEQETAARRNLESLDSSDQHRHADSAGAGERIRDLAAAAFTERKSSGQVLQRDQRSRSAAHTADRHRQQPVAAHVKAKQHAWQQQHEALQAPAYRLTLTGRREDLKTYNMGKGKGPDGSEKFYTAEEVQDLIPQLSRQNARGYDIYITPISEQQHYIVLDDTDQQRLEQMHQRTGITPALIQESSPGNLQAIICAEKVPGNHEQSNANYIVQGLNKAYGDPQFTGVVHPFRLAGFMNQKPKYEQQNRRPIVRPRPILQCRPGADPVLNQMLDRQRQQQQEQQQRQQRQERTQRIESFNEHNKSGVDERYRELAQQYCKYVDSKGWERDWSRIDYAIAGEMLKQDYYSENQIADAIKNNSPGIDERKQNPSYYAQQTVEKAAQSPEVQQQQRQHQLDGPRMTTMG